jgi:CubicO group peptidase (beta-lactamase class C family)
MLSASPPSIEAANGEIRTMIAIPNRLRALGYPKRLTRLPRSGILTRLACVPASIALTLALGSSMVQAAAPTEAQIDSLATRVLQEFSVPGLAVGIIKDGRVVLAKGYGVREQGGTAAVDANTLFAIGSNTKAFTTAALAILVDEGKIHWDDRVIDYLPDFRMWDPYVTREFRIRDLLTHRSGLGTGAGDLMFVTPTDFTRNDLLHALRYLKPVSSFRTRYAYDNLLYVIAGQIIPVVTGQSWEDFVTARILKSLHMDNCAVEESRLADHSNIAAPHVIVDGKLTKIPPLSIPLVAPAGAINCNVTGMLKWANTQLGRGKSPDGVQLFSAAQSAEMWSPQTILPTGSNDRMTLTHTHFASYGLGWSLEDIDGYERVSHNGGLPGMVTHVSLIPELNLGVVVLTNQQQVAALEAVSMQIVEGYANAPRRDWIVASKANLAKREQRIKEADAASAVAAGGGQAAGSAQTTNLSAYVGTFKDPWRGEATIDLRGNSLNLTFSHTHALSGPMVPVGLNLFVVHWADRSLNADAYVRFSTDYAGKVSGFTMQAVSASTDFSFDFQDLDFSKVAQ